MEVNRGSDQSRCAVQKLSAYRARRLKWLVFKTVAVSGLCLSIIWSALYESHAVNLTPAYRILPWLFVGICIFSLVVDFILFYADKIPFVKTWQTNRVEFYFRKYRNSIAYTYRKKV